MCADQFGFRALNWNFREVIKHGRSALYGNSPDTLVWWHGKGSSTWWTGNVQPPDWYVFMNGDFVRDQSGKRIVFTSQDQARDYYHAHAAVLKERVHDLGEDEAGATADSHRLPDW